MQILSLCFGIAGPVVAVVLVLVLERRRWLRRQYARRVIVHTTDDTSIEGTLIATAVDGIVLKAAKLLDAEDTPLGGDVFISSSKTHFIQLVAPGLDGS